jgi:hypothetical protein
MKYLGLYVSCIGALLLILVLSSSSLWFLRGVLGHEEGIIEFGYRGNIELLKSFTEGALVQAVESRLGVLMNDFYRIVYIRDAEVEYIVGMPRVSRQFGESYIMAQKGWKTQRFLWILTASRPINGESSIDGSSERSLSMLQGFKSQLRAFTIKDLPISPLFLAHLSTKSQLFDQPMSIYGELVSSKVVHIAISYDESFLNFRRRSVDNKDLKNRLYVSIQSDIFKNIQSQVISSVDDLGARLLRFSKTNPSVFSSLPSHTPIGILLDAENVAIGLKANGEALRSLAKSWAVAEQGARHPQRKAFALPDKTIGYEYVPTLPKVNFESNKEEQCVAASPYDEQMFFCGKSDVKVVASQDLIGAQLVEYLSSDQNNMSGTLSEKIVEKVLPGSLIKSLSFVGDEKGADIMADLK